MSHIRKCIVMIFILMMFKIQVECITHPPDFKPPKKPSTASCKAKCFFYCTFVTELTFPECYGPCVDECKHPPYYDASHK